MRYVNDQAHLAELLVDITRDRARAYAALADTRAELDQLRAELRDRNLDLAAARELLAYHGFTPTP